MTFKNNKIGLLYSIASKKFMSVLLGTTYCTDLLRRSTLTKYFLFCIFFLIQQFVLSISNCKCNTDNLHLQDKCLCNYVPIPHLHYILSREHRQKCDFH